VVGVHRGTVPRASAGGSSSIIQATVAIVVHSGAGPKGAMDSSGCQKDLGRGQALTFYGYRWAAKSAHARVLDQGKARRQVV